MFIISRKAVLTFILIFSLIIPVLLGTQIASAFIPSQPSIIPITPAVRFNNDATGSAHIKAENPTLISSTPFTIETWVKTPKPKTGNYIRDYSLITYEKPQTISDYGYIFKLGIETSEQTGTSRPNFSALIANSYSVINSNYLGVSGGTIQPNTWAHVAVTFESANNICKAKLFINGNLIEARERYSPNCQMSSQQPRNLTIAKPNQGAGGISGYYYNGDVDEIRISNTIRYTSNFTPEQKPFEKDTKTALLYHFNSNFKDEIDSRNDGVNINQVDFVDWDGNAFPTPTAIPSLTSTPTPTPIPSSGPFLFNLTNPRTSITCIINDSNCAFRSNLIAVNKLNVKIYTTIIGTSDGNTRYKDINGNWTSASSTYNKVVQPGKEALNTSVEVKPLGQTLGKQTHYFILDAKTCNPHNPPRDCYYYGTSKLTIEINLVAPTPTIIPSPTATPTIKPTSTPTPIIIKKFTVSGKILNYRRSISMPIIEIIAINLKTGKKTLTKVSPKNSTFTLILEKGDYRITPIARNLTFAPSSRLIKVDRNITNANFTLLKK